MGCLELHYSEAQSAEQRAVLMPQVAAAQDQRFCSPL
jgi:hypothetical protein